MSKVFDLKCFCLQQWKWKWTWQDTIETNNWIENNNFAFIRWTILNKCSYKLMFCTGTKKVKLHRPLPHVEMEIIGIKSAMNIKKDHKNTVKTNNCAVKSCPFEKFFFNTHSQWGETQRGKQRISAKIQKQKVMWADGVFSSLSPVVIYNRWCTNRITLWRSHDSTWKWCFGSKLGSPSAHQQKKRTNQRERVF